MTRKHYLYEIDSLLFIDIFFVISTWSLSLLCLKRMYILWLLVIGLYLCYIKLHDRLFRFSLALLGCCIWKLILFTILIMSLLISASNFVIFCFAYFEAICIYKFKNVHINMFLFHYVTKYIIYLNILYLTITSITILILSCLLSLYIIFHVLF